jgi:hypothetical protein
LVTNTGNALVTAAKGSAVRPEPFMDRLPADPEHGADLIPPRAADVSLDDESPHDVCE